MYLYYQKILKEASILSLGNKNKYIDFSITIIYHIFVINKPRLVKRGLFIHPQN